MSEMCKEATLACTQIPPNAGTTPSLSEFLTHVTRETDSSVQGLLFATNGTWPVLGFDKRSSVEKPKLYVRPIEGRDFDQDKVFELRLWVPTIQAHNPADGDVLAHEFRWVNGMDAVELGVTAGTGSSQPSRNKGSGVRGWVHAAQYLQHVPPSNNTAKHVPASPDKKPDQSSGGTGASHMTALEFIQEEEQYGNMAVTDQLFTGEWTK